MPLNANVPLSPLTVAVAHSSVGCLDEAIKRIDALRARALGPAIDSELAVIKEMIRDGRGPLLAKLQSVPGYPHVYQF